MKQHSGDKCRNKALQATWKHVGNGNWNVKREENNMKRKMQHAS